MTIVSRQNLTNAKFMNLELDNRPIVNPLFGTYSLRLSSRTRGRLHFMTLNLIGFFDGLILLQLMQIRATVLVLGQTTGD